MARPAPDVDDDKPLDPAVEKVRQKLVRFVGINLGLLFFALMAVVGAIVYKSRTDTPAATEEPLAPGAVTEGTIPLPAGAKIMSQSLSGNRMALDVELADRSRMIFLYDIAERRVVGRYSVTAQ